MLKLVAVVAALSAVSACAHPRRAMAGGAGMMVLGAIAESANSRTYCSSPSGCFVTGIGDGVANDAAHGAGEVLLVAGMVAIVGGLIGLSNEHEAHVSNAARR